MGMLPIGRIFLLLAILPAFLVLGLAAHARDGLSGRYGEMLVSVRDGQLTAVFATARGIDPSSGNRPMFSCAFMMQGRLVQGRSAVSSWTPGDESVIRGEITLAPPEARLRLEAEQPGCGMAAGSMTQADYVMHRDGPGTGWIGVGMVGAERAVLRGTPGRSTQRTPYLVRYNAVAILERKPGWAKVRYLDGSKPATGWLQEVELVPYAGWPARVAAP